MSQRLTLAIDPGERVSGLALFDSGCYVGCTAVFKLSEASAIGALRLLLWQVTRAWTPGEVEVAIETWTNPANRSAIESLAYARRTWQAACRAIEIPAGNVHLVNSTTWQSAVLGRGYKSVGGTKRASTLVASQIVGSKGRQGMTEDEADSICLGHWFILAGGVAGATNRASRKAEKKKGVAAQRASALELYRERGMVE